MDSNIFEKRIESIFKGYNLTQYRENKERGWIEFYYENEKDLNHNEMKYLNLFKLSNLVDSVDININAWTENEGCNKCKQSENYGYIEVRNVKY